MINYKEMINYSNIVNSINNIFINIESDIKKFIYESSGIVTRKTKLSYTDTFIYSLECCKINKTKIINNITLIITVKTKSKSINNKTIFNNSFYNNKCKIK